MIKYRVEIAALPDTREEALSLMENLRTHNETLSTSSVISDGKELWRVNFDTELGDDDRTIDELQEFVDKLKEAHAKVSSPKSE